jgi:hypothetical protein
MNLQLQYMNLHLRCKEALSGDESGSGDEEEAYLKTTSSPACVSRFLYTMETEVPSGPV